MSWEIPIEVLWLAVAVRMYVTCLTVVNVLSKLFITDRRDNK